MHYQRYQREHKRFDIEAYYWNKTKTFWFGPLIIGTKSEHFNLFQNCLKSNRNVFLRSKLVRNQNRTFLFLKNDIKTKPKRCKLRQGFLNTKKTFNCFKKIWKRTRTKAFGPKFSSTDRKRFVLFQNFVSKTNIFDLFWNKSTKTKAFDLERTLVWHCYRRVNLCVLWEPGKWNSACSLSTRVIEL